MDRIRVSGILFLSAFVAYSVGTAIGNVPLILLNSSIVIAIGGLLYPILAQHDPGVAVIYLAARIAEGLLLGIGGIVGGTTENTLYQVAMATLGIGSIFLCLLLLRSLLVPAFLALWGLVGYAIFALGAILELAGVSGIGIWFSIPGGLFEVAFGLWLIVRGFAGTTKVLNPHTSPL